MCESHGGFLPTDALNCEIIALSLLLQREISRTDGEECPEFGAQQTMPKPEHVTLFGPCNPLPWVPDRVGKEFSRENRGVLVIGSSYNGFIEGYSSSNMNLVDYLKIRDLIHEGKVADACAKFVREFDRQIMQPDTDICHGPILSLLLRDVPWSRVCLSSVCKASYVQRVASADGGTRRDYGGDTLICERIADWARYLTCSPNPGAKPPLPYEWIWRRIQNASFIVPLGVLAEYAVLKIFKSVNPGARIRSRSTPHHSPQYRLDDPQSPWESPYEQEHLPPSHWCSNHDWWVLEDQAREQTWRMLPVCHPRVRTNTSDPDYSQSRAVLGQMMREGNEVPLTVTSHPS